MRIACVQLAVEGGDVEDNVSRAVDRFHAAAEPTTVYADLDPERVARVREESPAWHDRRR